MKILSQVANEVEGGELGTTKMSSEQETKVNTTSNPTTTDRNSAWMNPELHSTADPTDAINIDGSVAVTGASRATRLRVQPLHHQGQLPAIDYRFAIGKEEKMQNSTWKPQKRDGISEQV